MRTEAITAPGYIHDVMATTFVLFITSPALPRSAPISPARPRFCHADKPTGVLLPDGRHARPRMDRAANIAAFNAIAAGEGDRFRRDIGVVDRDAGLLFAMLGGALWTRPTLSCCSGSLAARAARPRGAPRRSAAPRPHLARDALRVRSRRGALRAVGAACRAWAGKRLLRRDRRGDRLRAGSGRRADREGRRGESARRLRGADPRTGRRSPHRRRCRGDRRCRRRATGVRLASGETIAASRASSARSRRRSSTNGCSARRHRRRCRERRVSYRYGKGDMQIHYALKSPPRWKTTGLERSRCCI